MADDESWLLKEDGFLNVGSDCRHIIYHPNLNVLFISTSNSQVQVYDVNSGVVLQRCNLTSKASDGSVHGVYLGEGVDKILYTDGKAIGVRSDYNGVLLLDSILQMPVYRSEDTVKIELLLSDAVLLHHCLRSVELTGIDHVQEVQQELYSNIAVAKINRKKGIKAQKWNTVCLELPHGALKLVCSSLLMDLKGQNKHIPALPIASAINERLNSLLPSLVSENGPADKVLMYSEAARRATFTKWPHMNYKWALPDQMAQAGFYHQPNPTGQDRAMCFTCSVCLVCWEPTDEPWSEHERHSPTCPFVKGEYTQNVPLSVTLATAPAQAVGESVDVISSSNVSGVVATGSQNGFINVWNIQSQLKREVSFYINCCQEECTGNGSLNFVASKTAGYLTSLVPGSDCLTDSFNKAPNFHKLQLTALAIIDGSQVSQVENKQSPFVSALQEKSTNSSIKPCLVCGVSVNTKRNNLSSSSSSSQLRTLENVWASSTSLASSSSLVRAMNSANSAANISLDIMKVADGNLATPIKSHHYLILCDFYHKTPTAQLSKKETSKDSKNKKVVSGTGTSTSSSGDRQESLYEEILLGKFLLEEINEDVDSEMVSGAPFDSIYASPHHTALTGPTPNGYVYGIPVSSSVVAPNLGSSFDTNSNPVSPYPLEHYASSSSKMTQLRRTLDTIKTIKTDPAIIQTLKIEAPENLKITNVVPLKDGKHIFVTLCPQGDNFLNEGFSNSNQMDVDDETIPKSFMYWDHNDIQPNAVINGEVQNPENNNSIIIIYSLDFSDKVVKLVNEPFLRKEFPPEQSPIQCILLPIQEKSRSAENYVQPIGYVALICKDGAIRLLDLNLLKVFREAKLEGRKFISAAYCSRLERLCACTDSGTLHFFKMVNDDDSAEEKDVEDLNMVTDMNCDESEIAAPSTSKIVSVNKEQLLANKPKLTYLDLKLLYELTRFDRYSPAYGATVPPCWNEMMQAQRQRRYPQHLHQSEDQQHTRTWRLQNDASTWDEHIFELTLPRGVSGNVGHVDVRFTLHFPCFEIPAIQVTLLKQNITGIGNNKTYTVSADEKTDFKIGKDQKIENPVLTEEYQRHHKTEILCGPINLQKCVDLSDHAGCVTLTSPKLFKTKAKSLLVHIKALVDPAREPQANYKSKTSSVDSKPPTSKKLRIDEPMIPGSTVERFAAGANKNKLDSCHGCDWIYEVSITVRSVLSSNVENEKLQRCAMLESKLLIENLLKISCMQTSEKSLVSQSLALDILIWIVAIKLTRLRTGLTSNKTKTLQLETIQSIQEKLPELLKVCLLQGGRSVAHKCVKLIVLCSEGLNNLEESAPHAFDEAVLNILVTLLPSIINVRWSGSLRWLAVLITRLLPLDKNHMVAQQCIKLIQDVSAEMAKRVDPYHLLLATRYGLNNSPFEIELFDMEPPVSPKSTSVPVTNTYSCIPVGEQSTTSITPINALHTQDPIDLRDLLSSPSYSADLLLPSKLKALCTNHCMKGLLEVEPLHFTCHAASDGTKLEKLDTSITLVNIASNLYEQGTPSNNPTSNTKVFNPTYNFDPGSIGPDLQAKLTTKLSDLLNQCNAQKNKIQDFYTADDQSDSDELNNVPCNTTHIWSIYDDKHAALVGTKVKPINNLETSASANKIEDISIKKRDDVNVPWGRLLCWPPQKALVVERMFSGARRFVILDFGAPILLTDLMFPACNYLVSLSIDIWTKSEESDGIRLVVAGDIGTKPLVVSDLQPPPVCRYLKITTIGRYGMAAARCKIPLGMFYGHMIILPGEDYSELNNSSEEAASNTFDSNLLSSIESQCNVLSTLAEDVQCRFTLATERLKSYLDPILNTETPNIVHMQHYLNQSKNSSGSKEQPPSKILSTYQECIMYQHQLNTIHGVWQRLETWKTPQNFAPSTLENSCTDKLRILGETLLDILLYTVYEFGPNLPLLPSSLYELFTPKVCENLFNSICVMTPTSHLQLYIVALLSRMVGQQPWWGNFLADTLINLYSSSCKYIFAQDRVFILLTFLGRKSLIASPNKSSVIDAMVRTLGKLLSPLPTSGSESTSNQQLDTTLVGWVLLFLSVCLDTTFNQPQIEESNDKSKDQASVSRWEFIQGELAMQKKFVSSSRTSASRNYRKKLQKRLLHHKQQLQDLEAKKSLHAPLQAHSILNSQVANFSSKLEAAFKSQERFYKKTLKQHSSKHFKEFLGIRRNDLQLRVPKSQMQPSTSQSDSFDAEIDSPTNLSHQYVLPVARGLISLLLNNASNIDIFLLACKVVARLVISTRPAITLSELMSEEQLLKLIRLATGVSDTAWSSHAVSCLLQDLLEAERLYPRNITNLEASVPEESFDSTPTEESSRPPVTENDCTTQAGTSGITNNTFANDEGFADGDDDTQDSIIINTSNSAASKTNGFNLPSVVESDDSEFEEYLDNILDRGKSILKKSGIAAKFPTAGNSGISQAIDARLEYGVDVNVEILLRRLSALGTYNLPLGINTQIQHDSNRQPQNLPRTMYPEQNTDSWSCPDSIPSSLLMLTKCFDNIFTYYIQNPGTSIELVLQLWLILNLDAASEQNTNSNNANSNSQFDPSLTPVIPLSPAAINGIISAFSWHPGLSLRAWCYALQSLTLASNQPLQPEQVEGTNAPLDGLLGGMAGCIVKERNMGALLLRLLSGNGLNVDTANKTCGMAGPTLCQALQEFLVRLQMRCDVITVGSVLGNTLKELLLGVVYQLVQPGGALVARRGPLDAQCKLINLLVNLNFTNTHLGTAMSISECVGELVSTYVRGIGVGTRCCGSSDSNSQSGGFGGLYASVLGGDTRQGRPASWDALIVALIKLVCKLIQTPLPNLRTQKSDNATEMEMSEHYNETNNSSSSELESQVNINTSQTDESKVAEQQVSVRQQQTSKPKLPCVADTVLQHQPTMMRLLSALAHTSGSSLAMLLGEGSTPTTTTELTAIPSIPDATFQLLTTLSKKASSPSLILNPVYQYLASTGKQNLSDYHIELTQLSEPLLWFMLRILDNENALRIFTEMDGIKVLSENLVKSSRSCNPNSSNNCTGVIALLMQHLSNASNLVSVVSSSAGNTNKKVTNIEATEEKLMNFAPLGTVSWLHPTAQPADVLIHNATPHRRARTAAWSYHFYPDEAWVDLTITLPCAILLKEVELHPHLTSLSTCPSAVALEISREGNSSMTPVCAPMPTAGLTFIRLTLPQPEVATAVLVRLYKPRDSSNTSLSQIRLLGTTAFGDCKSNQDNVDEEKLTKTSLGWLRLIHQCLSVSSMNSSLNSQVLNSACKVEGLVEACCNLLLLPAPSLFTPNLEKVLLQLGLHSSELGLKLINILLNDRAVPLMQDSYLSQDTSTVQMVVELLEQLCSSQDANTKERMSAVLSWLLNIAKSSIASNNGSNLLGSPNSVAPPAIYIHCISTIIWKTGKLENLNYNLKELLSTDLFNSLYEWTLVLNINSALKQAVDASLCAFCCVKPEFFQELLSKIEITVPNLKIKQDVSSGNEDDREIHQTDDRKSSSANNSNDCYSRLAQSEFKKIHSVVGQLLSVASAARSASGISQLINSGLPNILSVCICEFANREISKESVSSNRKVIFDECQASTSSSGGSSLTDSDKVGEPSEIVDNVSDTEMDPESIAVILEFFSITCSEGKMRDWLGTTGSIIWLPLLTLLNLRPIENPSMSTTGNTKSSLSFAKLETATIKFLSRCCWCHPFNQKLLAQLLKEVICQPRPFIGGKCLGISGFTRRLILQLLLEGEKILISVSSQVPMKLSSIASNNLPTMSPHPAFPLGHYHHLLYLSTQSTVGDILQHVSGILGTGSLVRNRDLWESSFNLVMDTLNVAAANTAKDKRAKEASNRSQARGPVIRKQRINADGTISLGKSCNSVVNPNGLCSQNYLELSSKPDSSLSPELTIAQVLSIVKDSGNSLSEPCLHLTLKQRSKDSKEENSKANNKFLLTAWTSCPIDSSLEVFSAVGGLSVLAKHLPLIYPESKRPIPQIEKSPVLEQPDADWVKIEPNNDTYEDLDDGTNTSSRTITQTPQVPPHSLVAFGLFLRLPGYSEVLLRDRKRAQCLLRLALGVTDDGEGGDILTSYLASSLPTLPFQVLKTLLDDTPPTTDDGLLLRKSSVEVGAVHLLLNCLAIFTHQSGQNDSGEQKSGPVGSIGRADDKSRLYWAKGTGFGTGSTQQSWNVEQALMRQRSEEEHVTVLLQVLASYIGSGEYQPLKELPSTFIELLSHSCLLPALSSYLLNDSVLDMARHIPLYRAVLQLIRSMANSNQLAPLLLPRSVKSSESIVSLLTKMKVCVDNYVSKINRTKNNKNKGISKYPDDTEQDEGLATLIPDIQESADIVQKSTAKFISSTDECAGPSPSGPEISLKSIEQRYLEVMKNLQFDTYEMITENTDGGGFKFAVSHHFEANMRAAGERFHPARVKRLAQEAVTLSTALPLSYSSSVFVRCDTDRLDVMKVLITGPSDTPYANGCFEFDVYFPSDYPNSPMMINLETTGRHSVRFNPNLYNDGKVCLSVLNTWHGRPEEKWNAHTSSFLQVLVSIQSLILVSEPYFNEPGYERSRGTPSGAQSSQEYNANVCQATVKWAMLDQIKNPCPCFKEVIHTHFWLKRNEIVSQIEGWIKDMETQGADRRSGRTISLSALALQRHYKVLREELNKLPTPEGLEDLAEPLRSPSSSLEMTATPSTPPTSVVAETFATPVSTSVANAVGINTSIADGNSNVTNHELDIDVEMEKIVSKVCE